MKTDFLVSKMWMLETSSCHIVRGKKTEHALEHPSEALESLGYQDSTLRLWCEHDQLGHTDTLVPKVKTWTVPTKEPPPHSQT